MREGQRDISRDFPRVQENFAVIGAELRDTLRAIVLGTSIITHLELVAEESGAIAATDRFSTCVREHTRHVPGLDQQLDRLRGESEVIRAHVEVIVRNLPSSWKHLPRFLASRSHVSEVDIATALADIYEGGRALYDSVYGLERIVAQAMASISTDGASSSPDNRRDLLRRYGKAFGDTQARASFAALRLQEIVTRLS